MKILMMTVFLLPLFVACAGPETPNYCDYPAIDTACTVEGESAAWGPGPNTFCPTADGTIWHVAPNGEAIRYATATDGSLGWAACLVLPSGEIILHRTRE